MGKRRPCIHRQRFASLKAVAQRCRASAKKALKRKSTSREKQEPGIGSAHPLFDPTENIPRDGIFILSSLDPLPATWRVPAPDHLHLHCLHFMSAFDNLLLHLRLSSPARD
jgi:hypothetical protein